MKCSEEYMDLILDLARQAQLVHKAERGMTLQSIDLVWELHRRYAPLFFGISAEKMAKDIGLTPSVYFKRVQMGRLFQFHPRTREMFLNGETEISCLGVIAGKMTQANENILLEGIKGKSKREVEAFASRVNRRGEISEEKGYHDINSRLDEDAFAEFERLRDVLSYGGKVPVTADVLKTAIRDSLEKRDPVRKAERAQARAEKKALDRAPVHDGPARSAMPLGGSIPATAAPAASGIATREEVHAPAHETLTPLDSGLRIARPIAAELSQPAEKPKRTYIPAAVQHTVILRDGGRCSFIHGDGSRCNSRSNIHIDHRLMVCRGGDNEASNLRLLCFYHNQMEAELSLGTWLDEKRKQWLA